jgi:hypothetical protein
MSLQVGTYDQITPRKECFSTHWLFCERFGQEFTR